MVESENSMRKYSRSNLASLKKGMILSREAQMCAGEDRVYFRFMRQESATSLLFTLFYYHSTPVA
jgi:hypothetical protein